MFTFFSTLSLFSFFEVTSVSLLPPVVYQHWFCEGPTNDLQTVKSVGQFSVLAFLIRSTWNNDYFSLIEIFFPYDSLLPVCPLILTATLLNYLIIFLKTFWKHLIFGMSQDSSFKILIFFFFFPSQGSKYLSANHLYFIFSVFTSLLNARLRCPLDTYT